MQYISKFQLKSVVMPTFTDTHLLMKEFHLYWEINIKRIKSTCKNKVWEAILIDITEIHLQEI